MPDTRYSQKLIELLETGTFQGGESVMSNWGRVKVAHKYLRICSQRKYFLPQYAALGELDFLLATARLQQESQKDRQSLCFATYIGDQTTPCLKADGCGTLD